MLVKCVQTQFQAKVLIRPKKQKASCDRRNTRNHPENKTRNRMKAICSTVLCGSLQKSRGVLVLQQCLCWTNTASSTFVITLIIGEGLWDACGRLLRMSGEICQTCRWRENVIGWMFNSVMLQPGTGFYVWIFLVVISSLWGCELLNIDHVSDPVAGTSSLNGILGLSELGFSDFLPGMFSHIR